MRSRQIVPLRSNAKEVSLGRVFGPTAIPPLESLQVSRCGVIPNLSFPFGHSVRAMSLVTMIKAGHAALMGKLDIKSPYRISPVHPSSRHLLGMF